MSQLVRIFLDNAVRFQLTQELRANPHFLSELKRDLVFPNPAYKQAERFKRSTRGIPENLTYYTWHPDTQVLEVPRGYLSTLTELLSRHGCQFHVADRRLSRPFSPPVSSRIQLREYQVKAIGAATNAPHQMGAIEAPAGSGKTQMGLEIVARLGESTLWLTHTHDLAKQAKDRAVQYLGLEPDEVGLLGEGEWRLGPRFTIGIIATLAQRNLSEIRDRFGLVIIDEVHHTPARTWQKVVHQFPARYRFGLTATPERGDDLEPVMHLFLGPTVCKVTHEDVLRSEALILPRLVKVPVSCEKTPQAWEDYCREKMTNPDAVLNYNRLLDELLNDPQRNRKIVTTIIKEAQGHSCLVLSERVAHCYQLQQMLHETLQEWGVPGLLKSEVIHGSLAKEKRNEIVQQMRDGHLDILFAVDIAKEGLDIPRLDRLFITAGGRSEREIKQGVGRTMRVCKGKEDSVVFDFVDQNLDIFRHQYYARRRVYKQLGMVS